MFSNCQSLTTVPQFNTALVETINSAFSNCTSLSAIPALNGNGAFSASGYTSIFASCFALARSEVTNFKFTHSYANCKLSAAELGSIFTRLPTVASSQTITVTGNYGVGVNTSKASLSLTAGSTTIPMADTSGITLGMYVTGTGTGITTGRTVVSDVSADTLTLTAHGLANNTPVSFSSLGTTTGVSLWTIYYVVSATANTFQVALTVGGAAINLTGTGGNMTLRYPSFVTAVNTNVDVTIDTPIASTGTQTLTFRNLDASTAMLKNWAVTF
jgi:hypothetical protein